MPTEKVVTGPWRENCWIVSDTRGRAAIIDPGGDPEQIVTRIESTHLRPEVILGTHGHHDHIGAVAYLKQRYGIPFYLHSSDSTVLRHANLYRLVFDRSAPIDIPAIDGWLDSLQEIAAGDLTFTIIPTPGHTPGGVSFVSSDGLFSGDTILQGRVGRSDLPGGNRKALAASLRTMLKLPLATVVFPGHGEPTRLEAEVAHNQEVQELLR